LVKVQNVRKAESAQLLWQP